MCLLLLAKHVYEQGLVSYDDLGGQGTQRLGIAQTDLDEYLLHLRREPLEAE